MVWTFAKSFDQVRLAEAATGGSQCHPIREALRRPSRTADDQTFGTVVASVRAPKSCADLSDGRSGIGVVTGEENSRAGAG